MTGDATETAQKSAEAKESGRTAEDEASVLFARLEPSRQVLVFKSIKQGLEETPQNENATFTNCVKAYIELQNVVTSGKSGQFGDEVLERLQQSVAAAGGKVAPGLKAEGVQSIASFRKGTFELFRERYSQEVFNALVNALNTRLSIVKHNDVGLVFQEASSFFRQALDPNNQSVVEIFSGMTPERQVDVFKTIEITCRIPTKEVEDQFAHALKAIGAFDRVLDDAENGCLTPSTIEELNDLIRQAGGQISVSNSILTSEVVSNLFDSTYRRISECLDSEVAQEAYKMLNQVISRQSKTSFTEVTGEVLRLITPIITSDSSNDLAKSFQKLSSPSKKGIFTAISTTIRQTNSLDKINLKPIVAAYEEHENFCDVANRGALGESEFTKFQAALAEAGDMVAPDLCSQGINSVSSARDEIFKILRNHCYPEVVESALEAANAKLRSKGDYTSYTEVVSTLREFLRPILLISPSSEVERNIETDQAN